MNYLKSFLPTFSPVVLAYAFCLLTAGAFLTPATAIAEDANPGQADLTAAIEAKLTIEKAADLDKVIDLAKSALEKGLDDANTEFANELISSSHYERAEYYCRPIFEKQPPSPLWRQLAKLARTDLEEALKYNKDLGAAYLLQARLNLLPDGDRVAAANDLDAAIGLLADDSKSRSEAYLLKAGLTDDNEGRMELLDKAIKEYPDNMKALRLRGVLYLQAEDFDKAVADLKKVIENETDDAAMEAYAEALTSLKRFDDAVTSLDKLIKRQPEEALPYVLKGRVLLLQEKDDEALQALNKALELDDRNVPALLMRSRLLFIKEKEEEALSDVDRALQLQPGSPGATLLKSQLLAARGSFAEAISLMKRLTTAMPENRELKQALAGYYMAGDQFSRALDVYDKLLESDPRDFDALRGRADCYLNMGLHDKALKDYEAAVEINEEDPALLNNLAWLLATSPADDLRDGKRAIKLATKACELSEYKAAHIISTLAAGYAETGDFETAKKWAAKAVELADEDNLEQIKNELESYQQAQPWREKLEDDKSAESEPQPGDLDLEEGLEID